MSYFDDTASYDKYNRAFSNCCNVINGINRAVSSFVTAIANIILISQLLAWMNPFNTTSLALNHVSFSISAGESVAIVGRNGAGKTTIIKLLLRLYEPTSGEIYINDTNIKEYNTESLRNTICSLFQDYALFAFSIRDNIELGKTEPPDCIWSALEQVELKDKVNTLPHTYDTPITSQLYADGIELSGGESQKLAISRIYARNAQVIAMDEPTSSLDPKSEFTLYQQILNNTKPNAIVIIVSHRLTLTYKMSKIIVLEHGQVKEQGTHNELIKLNGIYKELYSMQANKYTTNM